MDDDRQLPDAAEYRRRSERARVEARSRYRAHLAQAFSQRGVDDAPALADVALDALTEWNTIDTGERCRCSCHPRLPDSDRHDFGFDCTCTHTREQCRAAFRRFRNDIDAYWQSPEGQQIRGAHRTAETELHDWLTQHPGVVVRSHGGYAPEQWRGTIDGHSFYFRERHGDWDIEVDLRPTGRFIHVPDGKNDDGNTRYRQHALERGDVIATGTIDADNYGTTLVERARFLVTTIRDHLMRNACTHHLGELDSVATILGIRAAWCPSCGSRLAPR